MKQASSSRAGDPFYYKYRNFFVGLFVLIPLLVIPALLIFTLVKSEIFESRIQLHLRCETGTGLKRSTEVNLLGTKVGRVNRVSLNEGGYVDVSILLKKRYSHFIRKDSKAYFKQKNFVVGDWEIDLTMGSRNAAAIEDGDTLAVEYQIRLEKLVEVITQMVAPLESMVQSLAKGEGILKYIFGEDTIFTNARSMLGRVDSLLTGIDRTLAHADRAIGNLAALGSHGIVTVDSLMIFSQEAGNLVRNLDDIAADVDSLIAGFENLPDDLDSLLLMLRQDMRDAEVILDALKHHWLLRRTIERRLREEENPRSK